MESNKHMELREYIRILQKNITILIGITLILGMGAAVFTLRIPEKHEAQFSVYIHKVAEQPQSGDFAYDGYYAQLTAEAFTDTVVGLFESTTTAKRALEIADIDENIAAVKSLHSKIQVEKIAPQLIEVSVTDVNRQYAITTVEALYASVEQEVAETNSDTLEGLSVKKINEQPLVLLKKQLLWLNTLVGLFVGLFTGVAIVAIKVYAQDNKRHE